jgi:alkylated DNA repair dioxygenase AlkB
MPGLQLLRGWNTDPGLLDAVQDLFVWPPDADRVNGYLYTAPWQDWPAPFVERGRGLMDGLAQLLGVRCTVVAFQGYRSGSGCDWHADHGVDVQAVLSLGVSRTFGTRPVGGEPVWVVVDHGDLVVMPSGFQATHEHSVPVENVPGDRVSLVFRSLSPE